LELLSTHKLYAPFFVGVFTHLSGSLKNLENFIKFGEWAFDLFLNSRSLSLK